MRTKGSAPLGPPLGAFPLAGPLPYLDITPEQLERLRAGPYARPRTWYHATHGGAVAAILAEGLIPSCWWGGDGCCVFGYETLDDARSRETGWVIEIRSEALECDLKAWWVPRSRIVGVWHETSFHPAEQPAHRPHRRATVRDKCGCDLAPICEAEAQLWRETCNLGRRT